MKDRKLLGKTSTYKMTINGNLTYKNIFMNCHFFTTIWELLKIYTI